MGLAVRIVGGQHRGTEIRGPASDATRPTSDRLRESLFNVLVHRFGDPVAGARVLDLFAGTGALGLEALSRGAAFVLFVEEATAARATIRDNVSRLGMTGVSRVWRRDATRLGPLTGQAPFSLVFCDPPYGKGLGQRALKGAVAGGWMAPGALVILEESKGAGEIAVEGLEPVDHRAAGDSALHIFEHPA